MLRDAEAPDAERAEQRGRQVVSAAFAEREPQAPKKRSVAIRASLALVAGGVLTGFALTPAGADVRDWIADRVQLGEGDAEPRLSSLPAPGEVLVEAPGGAWVIREDGSKRLLGDFDEATWSPSGRFVGVTDGSELRAVDPAGNFRWSIDAGARVSALDWSTDEGFRVAYLAGGEVRVVTGDGLSDRPVAFASDVAPAWRPESDPAVALHHLTFVDRQNRVVTIATDTDRVIWRSQTYSAPVRSVEWSAAGDRLLVVAGDYAIILGPEGEQFLKGPFATGIEDAAISPNGTSLAVVASDRRGTDLNLVEIGGETTRLYSSGPGNPRPRFEAPVFSPDGEWVLLPWREADQWLFVNTNDRRVSAVADIARQFDADGKGITGFPAVAGWCCPE
ncbi:MAG: hypothetical protein M3331_07255 [Actinomycetota bacterium]|nr:hypothetical protein [Actinomycetota bacterium]